MMKLEVWDRARREVVWRRKSERKVIYVVEIPLAAMAAGEWLRKNVSRTSDGQKLNKIV